MPGTSKRSQSLTVRVPLELRAWAEREAARTGQSIGAIVVEALRAAQARQPSRKGAGSRDARPAHP